LVGFGAGGASVGAGGAPVGAGMTVGPRGRADDDDDVDDVDVDVDADADADADADPDAGVSERVGAAGGEGGVGSGVAEEIAPVFVDSDEDTGAGGAAGDSEAGGAGGAAEGVGCTVVYCVTMTTGGGSRGVGGRAGGRDEDKTSLAWLDTGDMEASSEARVVFEEGEAEGVG
jgi:hypothetical protein